METGCCLQGGSPACPLRPRWAQEPGGQRGLAQTASLRSCCRVTVSCHRISTLAPSFVPAAMPRGRSRSLLVHGVCQVLLLSWYEGGGDEVRVSSPETAGPRALEAVLVKTRSLSSLPCMRKTSSLPRFVYHNGCIWIFRGGLKGRSISLRVYKTHE